jgi:hypothetical protein
MPVISLGRLPRSMAARAAIIGATRALEAAYPVRRGGVLPDRLSEALVALVRADDQAVLQTAAVAA